MAADTFQIKRGNTAQVNAYVAAVGEPVLDTALKQLHIGDGMTAGGTVVGTLTTAFMATLLDDVSAAAALLTLGAASLSSPAFTGVPTVPTAAVDTNTTQAASTAFVVAQAASATPIIDGAGTVGTSLRYARQDHIHPTDTSRAPLNSPGLTGVPTAPTAAIGTNTTQIATMAALQARILGTVSQSGGVPTGTVIETGTNVNGTYTKWASGDVLLVGQIPSATPVWTAGVGVRYATVANVTLPLTILAGGRAAFSINNSDVANLSAQLSAHQVNTGTISSIFFSAPSATTGTTTPIVGYHIWGRWF